MKIKCIKHRNGNWFYQLFLTHNKRKVFFKFETEEEAKQFVENLKKPLEKGHYFAELYPLFKKSLARTQKHSESLESMIRFWCVRFGAMKLEDLVDDILIESWFIKSI